MMEGIAHARRGMLMLTGGCLCGAVRYRVAAEPLVTRVCWCRVCQYIGAGSATVNSLFPAAALSIEGVLGDYACLADSGNHLHRRFCAQCGTHVYAHADERPQVVVLRVGTLDAPQAVRPAMTIWTDSAPGWACIDADLPATPRQPPPVG